jgi:hypothetical protein
MEIPKRMLKSLKEIASGSDTAFARCAVQMRPFTRENCKSGQTALRMIYGPCTTHVPYFVRQNQPLQIVAMRPPTVP